MFAIWLKVDRLFSGYKSDIYICITYLPPENSSYYRQLNINCIDIVEKQIQHFSALGDIILLGDTNARTACNNDYVINDVDRFIPDVIPYIIDNDLPKRHSQDMTINERGTNILDMCVSSGLRILNGREPGDTIGYYTCNKYNGSSVTFLV